MKKIYFDPEMEFIELDTVELLAGSTGADGGDDDGGTTPNPTDPSDPDWGSDY